MRSPLFFSRFSVKILLLFLLFIAAVGFFGFIMHEVFSEREEEFDRRIFSLFSLIITPGRTTLMRTVTYFASSNFLLVGYTVVIIFFALKKCWPLMLHISVIGTGGYLITHLMKKTFHRIRPTDPLIEHAQNFSFPSGHATSGFIFYGLIAYLIWKGSLPQSVRLFVCVLLVLFALLIGLSRVYLRVHYASDVLGGICTGVAWLLLSTWFLEQNVKKISN